MVIHFGSFLPARQLARLATFASASCAVERLPASV